MTELDKKIEQLQQIIDHSRQIVFFTGAGVSTDSGIPDFRSQDGLYHLQYQYPPEEIISHHFFKDNPREFYRFYKDKMLYLDAKPNFTHQFIAELENHGKSLGVITQNIDGLHQKAGSKHVYELHGSVLRNYCTECNTYYPVETIASSKDIPICPKCGHIIKPDVVLYEEGLSDAVVNGAVAALQSADTLIVLGTSLVVYPAAGLLRFFYGKNIVLINQSVTPYDNQADLLIQARFNEVIPKLHI